MPEYDALRDPIGWRSHAERINAFDNPADGTGLGVVHTRDTINGLPKEGVVPSNPEPNAYPQGATPPGHIPLINAQETNMADLTALRQKALEMATDDNRFMGQSVQLQIESGLIVENESTEDAHE